MQAGIMIGTVVLTNIVTALITWKIHKKVDEATIAHEVHSVMSNINSMCDYEIAKEIKRRQERGEI